MISVHGSLEILPPRMLAGKAALIIGGSETPGLALAIAAREEGARVALAEPARPPGKRVDPEPHERPTGAPHDRLPGVRAPLTKPPLRFACSLDDEHEVDDLFDRAVSTVAPLDLVLACFDAETLPPAHELSLSRWRERATDPLRRAFWIARRAAEEFLSEGRPGRVVFVLTTGPQEEEVNEVVRDGLSSLTRSFAREYGRKGMAMNLLVEAPPSIASSRESLIRRALFLSSDAASFVNGEIIVAIGGLPALAREGTIAR